MKYKNKIKPKMTIPSKHKNQYTANERKQTELYCYSL